MAEKIEKRSLNVSVYIEVFNEEHRIEACLQCFQWAKELVVFDKGSTDRTVELAKKYATKLVIVPKTVASENYKIWSQHLTCEWSMSITASSLIHPAVVSKISSMISNLNFEYDVIGLPYGMYAFGIRSHNSAWTADHKLALIRRKALIISDKLHEEIGFKTKSSLIVLTQSPDEVFYHLTHESLDSFMDRITRYAAYEANWTFEANQGQNRGQVLRHSFYQIIRGLGILILKRRFFIMGWDGWVMALAYLFNLSCNTIFLWERYRQGQSGREKYAEIRVKMCNLWDEEYRAREAK